ncbi:heavy-metal-associated domain-containing protein [Qipengyuania sp. JC766]|uniref:heavy-metal-associated domain-containing protein n=1 Tax=Qipengyuania sp. JC766 TaxID=3232139 RepID=UPI003457D7FA
MVAAFVLLALGSAALVSGGPVAQVAGDRGIAPVMASTDIVTSGIEVDERGDNPEDARQNGWREAQRKAWAQLGGPSISDSQLDSMVSAIVIEQEQIGPRRYRGTLGVVFDRGRAGALLGRGGGARSSAPMLLIPVTMTAGSQMVYEQRNPWQRAWAEFQPGGSLVNYVRPSGAGGDSLLVTYGQTKRRSRAWWRNVLDEFQAADVLVPIARLDYEYPGGPVVGTFTARIGPDSEYLDSFTLRASSPRAIPEMMTQAVRRFDQIFATALNAGRLTPDSTLNGSFGAIDPELAQLIEAGRAAEARVEAARAARERPTTDDGASAEIPTPETTESAEAVVVQNFVVQFPTPDADALAATLGAVRGTPGVRGAAIGSTAIGGTSVMRVSFGGELGELAAALRARGFAVTQGSGALSISR